MKLLALPLAIAAVALPAAALAQEEPDNWSFEFNLGTDNRSKGASKSEGEPFAFAAVEWADDSGQFYISADGETIDHSTGSDFEAEVNAGWRPQAAGFAFDFNVAHKWYLNANPGADDDAWELTADVSRRLSPRVDTRVRFQYSPDSAGSTRSWTWVEARGRVRLTDRIRASAALGRREQVNSRDYTAWNIGADFEINDWASLDVRWYDTDVENPSAQYDSALVAVLNLGF